MDVTLPWLRGLCTFLILRAYLVESRLRQFQTCQEGLGGEVRQSYIQPCFVVQESFWLLKTSLFPSLLIFFPSASRYLMSFSVPWTLFPFFYLARREASLFLQNSLHPVIVQGSLLWATKNISFIPWPNPFIYFDFQIWTKSLKFEDVQRHLNCIF